MSEMLLSTITAFLFILAVLGGCRTALEQDPPPANSSTVASRSTDPAPAPIRTTPPSIVIRGPSKGLVGLYSGAIVAKDDSGETIGSQPFSVTIQPASSPSDPRAVASIRLQSSGSQFQDVDYTAALDIEVDGAKEADGMLRYEFLTDCKKIPNLTATRVKLRLELFLDPSSSQVDSSQSSMNILDCGFSGDAGWDHPYDGAEISDFGKR